MKALRKTFLIALCVVLSSISFFGCANKSNIYELPHYDYADSDGTMWNTDIFYSNTMQALMGDPTMLTIEEDGETWFYATGTQSGVDFRMWKSKDLSYWENLGVIYTPEENAFQETNHWAPNIIFDKTAKWNYYLGADAGNGQGLYCLFFTARDNDNEGQTTQLQVAFSKKIDGPYKTFKGINANGDYCDASTYHFDVEKLKGLGLYENHIYGALYHENRRFLDSYPFIDPVTGDKYMYFVRGRGEVANSNDIWGVKMKDWVSPDYATTTPLTSFGYVSINKTEEFNWQQSATARIDEGPVMIYRDFTDDNVNNGTYYLTCSVSGTNDKYYSPVQALGTSPLGEFKKVQPEDGGFICVPEAEWDIIATGHHDLVMVGNELYNVYHTYSITNGVQGSRFLACDKVEFIKNSKGQTIMYTNGPSKTPQPLPEIVTGYKNIAPTAKVDATNCDEGEEILLNDGLVPMSGENHIVKEFSTTSNTTTITLTFDDWVTARAIMVYNSSYWQTMFTNIERVEFKTKNGTAYINDLGFNVKASQVPYDYFNATQDEINSGNYDIIRPLVASIAEFNETKIKQVKITIKRAEGKTGIGIGDIFILGKDK